MTESLYSEHVEHCSVTGRQGRDQLHDFLISQILYLRRHVTAQTPCILQCVAQFQRIIFPQGHKCSIDKDPSRPSFERALVRKRLQLAEKRHKTILQDIFGGIAVSHITDA